MQNGICSASGDLSSADLEYPLIATSMPRARRASALVLSLVMTRGRAWTLTTVPRAMARRFPLRAMMHTSTAACGHAEPATEQGTGLRLLNSLTQQTEPFVPIDPRLVKWYVCGPTVYDASHVGHARNYVAFDIVRRVLIDYFGFDVLYVMNITDIDDKIILRTHRRHLEQMLAGLTASTPELEAACVLARDALNAPQQELGLYIDAQRALCAAASASGVEGLLECDVQSDFLKLTAEFEKEFFDDMAALNVLPPDAVTRVSDYLPEIIAYIETIMSNGYCYESNGSVYFDTAAFRDGGKSYGKLDPTKVGAAEGKSVSELLLEGEGALSAGSADKRQPSDFVLWKASKRGEPAWASPWGEGRPGWHIECSAMASDLLGDQVDLNAGGADLKFPHHENQMAQAEAHFDCCSWVNYFLHSGHLQIEGLKMSKSLKNFITIQGALERYSAEQIRFLFLLRKFSEPMEYSENTMSSAVDMERRFSSFSASLAARLREASDLGAERAPTHKWGGAERELHATLAEKRAAVHSALQNSIDTSSALKALEQLIRATNVYMGSVSDVGRGATLLTNVQRYFSKMMKVFGLASLAADAGGGASSSGGASMEEIAGALSSFRDQVRGSSVTLVKGGGEGEKQAGQDLLKLCDDLRDDVLPALGVLIEDRPSGVGQMKLTDPKLLLAEVERKREAAAQAAMEKEAKQAARAQLAALEAQRAAVPASEMFRSEHDALFERAEGYGSLDENGLPMEDASGEMLSKSARKKLGKAAAKQEKVHAAYLQSQE